MPQRPDALKYLAPNWFAMVMSLAGLAIAWARAAPLLGEMATAGALVLAGAAALLFVALFGVGNGMLTIVKGTVMAQYVSAAHVGALNGALGLPLALARAAAPLAVGLLWSPAHGYAPGLALLVLLAATGVALLWRAQARVAQASPPA